jgi:hypothetical protein
MKPTLFFALFASLFFSGLAQAAPHGPAKGASQPVLPVERISEARCYDIKQSVLADLPHFCGTKKTDKVRLIDFGHQLDLLEKKCGQPELAYLLKKALNERVNKNSQARCNQNAEKMVQSAANDRSKAAISASDF